MTTPVPLLLPGVAPHLFLTPASSSAHLTTKQKERSCRRFGYRNGEPEQGDEETRRGGRKTQEEDRRAQGEHRKASEGPERDDGRGGCSFCRRIHRTFSHKP
ncbi:hypothetical protein C8R46DRAFT_1341445 [Mycena filopes]|nr:hypothetical protein C8R46DRAFT_1341445 [Mycena filopes]